MRSFFFFEKQAALADDPEVQRIVRETLLRKIPGACDVARATKDEDRAGTDFWVHRSHSLPPISIDLKARPEDCLNYGSDDLCLETWNVIEQQIPGWTRDPRKRTDYVLWVWKDTRRTCLVSFPQLCRVFTDKWQEWRREYEPHGQFTRERAYGSECIFVPRFVVHTEIHRFFG